MDVSGTDMDVAHRPTLLQEKNFGIQNLQPISKEIKIIGINCCEWDGEF